MKTDLFQSCGNWWVCQICWHIECSILTGSSFRIWNSSAEILSPLLALFVVTLPKTHLASHSRMSYSRWVITPSWLSGSLRSFLHTSSRYSCHFFLISSASVSSLLFLSLIVPFLVWNPLIPPVSLKRSQFFLTKLCKPLPYFILHSKAKLSCYPRISWLTFVFHSPTMKRIFFFFGISSRSSSGSL